MRDKNDKGSDRLDYPEIGRQVRRLRRQRGWSQARLAEQADLSDTYISHIERATKQVSLNALLRLAAALEVTLDQLLSGSQPQDTGAYLPELQTLFQDCSLRERRVLLDIAGAVKEVLRANHWAA